MTGSDESGESIKKQKEGIRNRIWKLMEESCAARFPRPVFGRIPNFDGADSAALKASTLREYQDARCVKINPDAPQRMLRYRALSMGKVLLVPTPRLREGFLRIDPSRLPKNSLLRASTIAGSFQYGKRVGLTQLPKIDLIVVGCVAVSPSGGRLGKGEGYGEIEYAILREKERIDAGVPVLTTVHETQIVQNLPWEMHDVPVDIIVTASRVIFTETKLPKPTGVYWDRLSRKKLEEITVLQELRKETNKRGI